MGTRVMLAALLLVVLGTATAFFEQQPLESQAHKEEPAPVPEDVWMKFVTEFQKSSRWQYASAARGPEFRVRVQERLAVRSWHVQMKESTLFLDGSHYIDIDKTRWQLSCWTERDATGVEKIVGTLSAMGKPGARYLVDAKKLSPITFTYLSSVTMLHPRRKPAPEMEEKRVGPGATLRLLLAHMGVKNFAMPVDNESEGLVQASFKGCTCEQAVKMICDAAGWRHFWTTQEELGGVDLRWNWGLEGDSVASVESIQQAFLRAIDDVIKRHDEQLARTPDAFSAGPG